MYKQAGLVSLATTSRVSVDFLSYSYLDVSVHCVLYTRFPLGSLQISDDCSFWCCHLLSMIDRQASLITTLITYTQMSILYYAFKCSFLACILRFITLTKNFNLIKYRGTQSVETLYSTTNPIKNIAYPYPCLQPTKFTIGVFVVFIRRYLYIAERIKYIFYI